MHGDYAQMILLVLGVIAGTGLSVILGLWLIAALIWGQPGLTLWFFGGLSWLWWVLIAIRLVWLQIFPEV
ncbi:MAG: hypothetical protein KG075_09605 [Alphaproteobacteria bacterium]|nr:hypothetical protein [Alphaproteobacteria bacterium]